MRIALSQGEVRRQKRDLHGEAMRLLHAAEALADAGEVVLTDAVYLSMTKSEAATEVLSEQPLPGGGRIRMRRARRGPDRRAPYGGEALARLGRLPDPGRTVRLRVAVDRAFALLRRRAVWAAAALLLLAAGVGERMPARDPLRRAAELVQQREPLAALAELDRVAATPLANQARVQVVRGKAEHALGEQGLAFADFAAAVQQDPQSLDDEAVAALADELESETFPPLWRSALVRLLGESVGRRCAPAVSRLLASPRADTRDAALEVLELSGAATDEVRLQVARADLADPRSSCGRQKATVHRLSLVGDPQAQELLASWRGSCGLAEARDALRRRARVASTR